MREVIKVVVMLVGAAALYVAQPRPGPGGHVWCWSVATRGVWAVAESWNPTQTFLLNNYFTNVVSVGNGMGTSPP